MEVLRGLEQLFRDHAPETLMALFGAATSLLLFTLMWIVLRHLFGLQARSADQESDQEQTTAVLLEALVSALVTEAGHLRTAMDGLLRESLARSEQTADALSDLVSTTEGTPREVLALLRPEFEHLHYEMHQVEGRIVDKVVDAAAWARGSQQESDLFPRDSQKDVAKDVGE